MNSDRLLVEKVLEGETQAFEELIVSYYPGLYGFLIKMGIPASQTRILHRRFSLTLFAACTGTMTGGHFPPGSTRWLPAWSEVISAYILSLWYPTRYP